MFEDWYRPIKNIQKTPINSNIFTIFEIGLDQFKNQPNHLRCLNCKGFYMFVYWSIPIYKPIKHLKNQHIFHHFKNWSIPISTVNFLIFADVFWCLMRVVWWLSDACCILADIQSPPSLAVCLFVVGCMYQPIPPPFDFLGCYNLTKNLTP